MGNTRKSEDNLNWAKLLAEERRVPAEDVPSGWKTTRDIAAEQGRSVSHTSALLRDAVREGRVEVKRFSVDVGPRTYPVPHYRILK